MGPIYRYIFVSLFLVGLAGLPSLGQAATIADSNDPNARSANPKWADTKKHGECGQACLYQRGNENISLEASYILYKLKDLKAAIKDGKDDDVRDTLRTFCTDQETAAECYNRYVLFETARLQKMGVAIGTNEDAAYRLFDQNKNGANVVQSGRKPNPNVRAQAADLLSEKEIQKELELKDLSSVAFDKWQKQQAVEPGAQDFQRFGQKSVQGPDGQKHDFYAKEVGSKPDQSAGDQLKQRLEKYNAEMTSGKVQHWGEVNNKSSSDRQSTLAKIKGTKATINSIESRAYNAARDDLVDAVNGMIMKQNAKNAQIKAPSSSPGSGANRAPAVQSKEIMETEKGENTYYIRWSPSDLEQVTGQQIELLPQP